MIGLKKRKHEDDSVDEDETGIAGGLKRVKITTTAGEL
eukprot:gene19529-14157_t